MNRVKNIITLALFSVTLAIPFSSVASAQVDQSNYNKGSRLVCKTQEVTYNVDNGNNDGNSYTTNNCDLKLNKEVSVDGGATFVEDTSATAPTVHVGDKVVWKVIVADNSALNNTPFGHLTVSDILPSSLTYVSSQAINPAASSYSSVNNNWKFDIPANIKTTPASLTITTTANTVGQVVNTAEITDYSQDRTDGSYCCYSDGQQDAQVKQLSYCDSNDGNNEDSAYVNVIAVPPVVITPVKPTTVTTTSSSVAPKVPNTGFGVISSNPIMAFSVLSLGSAGAFALARSARRFASN